MNIEKLYPVQLMVNPINRYHKRQVEFEYERIAHHFTEIEQHFYELLFDENNDFSYDFLYERCLELFLKEANFVDKVHKPKYFSINRDYFHDMMYPIEAPLT